MISIKRFKKFVDDSYEIFELNSDEIQLVFDRISEDCKEYINLFKENKNNPIILYRGESKQFLDMNQNIFDIKYFQKIKTLKDRRPKDMPMEIHSKLNNLFKERFGINLRSESVFCSRSVPISSVYGDNICAIFPIGEFRYFWNPKIEDLFQEMDYLMTRWDSLWTISDLGKFADEEIKSMSSIVDGYKDTDIVKALENEIMLVCDEYYLVSISDIGDLDKYDSIYEFVDSLSNFILNRN